MEEKEKSTYLSELEKSEQAMLAVLEDISETKFQQKQTQDIWSILEVLEHVVKVESTIISSLGKLSAEDSDVSMEEGMTDEEVMELSSNAELKSKSAPAFLPEGIYTNKEQALQAFKDTRLASVKFMATHKEDLGLVSFPHPRLGMLNGKNWLLFIAGHCLKHVAQVKNMLK